MFIVILFFVPVKQVVGGDQGEGQFQPKLFCQLSLSQGYWWKLVENKYSLFMMDVTAGMKAVMATQLLHNAAQIKWCHKWGRVW